MSYTKLIDALRILRDNLSKKLSGIWWLDGATVFVSVSVINIDKNGSISINSKKMSLYSAIDTIIGNLQLYEKNRNIDKNIVNQIFQDIENIKILIKQISDAKRIVNELEELKDNIKNSEIPMDKKALINKDVSNLIIEISEVIQRGENASRLLEKAKKKIKKYSNLLNLE